MLVGSVSFASPGPKAMHNASTAQEVRIITPYAKDLDFRVRFRRRAFQMPSDRHGGQRWNDPNPMPPCRVPSPIRELSTGPSGSSDGSRTPSPSPSDEAPPRFDPLPEQSVRTALILDRFSLNCKILYCSNDSLVSTTKAMGRDFFDFVIRRDEEKVRSWIDVVKGWGVNERGQPSDGGFGFGKFAMCVQGRDSRCVPVSGFRAVGCGYYGR